MSTYRVVTVHKTVYVHNVVKVDLGMFPDNEPELTFYRAGGNAVTFLKANVVSYEFVTNGGAE